MIPTHSRLVPPESIASCAWTRAMFRVLATENQSGLPSLRKWAATRTARIELQHESKAPSRERALLDRPPRGRGHWGRWATATNLADKGDHRSVSSQGLWSSTRYLAGGPVQLHPLGVSRLADRTARERTYGARRVWHDLLAEGVSCGVDRIERLMRLQASKHARVRPG
jgi:hypothetical protein